MKSVLLLLLFLVVPASAQQTSSRPPVPPSGIGCLIGDCQTGYGVLRTSDGRLYEGDWSNGQKHGRGVFTWADGQRYEGEWREGDPEGQGVTTWPTGSSYEGSYADGEPNGPGLLFHKPSGWMYEGMFRGGLRVGIHTAANVTTGRVERVRFNDEGTFVETIEVLVEGS